MDIQDEDLERALTLSLEDSTTGEQFQADLQRALQESRSQSQSAPPQHIPQTALANTSAKPNSFLSERAQLEKERLARQKRLRGDSDDRNSSRGQTPSTSTADSEDCESDGNDLGKPAAKRRHVIPRQGRTLQQSANVINRSSKPSTSSNTSTNQPPMFWRGEIRQTANAHVDPKKDTKPTFRLSEIIGEQNDIAFAIISSYSTDYEFAYKMFSPAAPVIIVSHPATENREPSMRFIQQNWIRITPKLLYNYSCMHMKFMLVFYKSGRLRTAITTANLVPLDWRDIENTAWVQDVPLRATPIARDPRAQDFPSHLEKALNALDVQGGLDSFRTTEHKFSLPLQSISDLRCRYNFSKVHVHLVSSLSGKFEGWPEVVRVGHPRLMKVVVDIGAKPQSGWEVALECQGSSVGKYNKVWLKEFYHSASGASAQDWIGKTKKADRLPWPGKRGTKILFPSLRTVRESRLGEAGGGTMFFKRADWASGGFPRELFHDSKSKRGGVLMHSKMILGTLRRKPPLSDIKGKGKGNEDEDDSVTESGSDDGDSDIMERKVTGWVYVGSHNFTTAAWGSFQAKSTTFTPVFAVSNYELGVVVPVYDTKETDDIVCWERPPKSYESQGDQPWIQGESAVLNELNRIQRALHS
ncbi:phospholipase D/nuclease [Thelephora ganbajun]|uniref:Phospholipase D/nuclease n=1 Tax=Thelephora ganbajun TaxID=370292 RepID=A0ACB6ZKS6_THEGA|nr:phospholipase D/nuclease [Thelephora ganbajun]